MKQINREAEKALRELAEEWKADSFLATADEFSIELLTLIDQCQVQEEPCKHGKVVHLAHGWICDRCHVWLPEEAQDETE